MLYGDAAALRKRVYAAREKVFLRPGVQDSASPILLSEDLLHQFKPRQHR